MIQGMGIKQSRVPNKGVPLNPKEVFTKQVKGTKAMTNRPIDT